MKEKQKRSEPELVELVVLVALAAGVLYVLFPHLLDALVVRAAALAASVRGDLLLFCRVALTLGGAWAGARVAAWLLGRWESGRVPPGPGTTTPRPHGEAVIQRLTRLIWWA